MAVFIVGPKLIVHVYGYDNCGADIVRGYGIVHIPVQPGRCVYTATFILFFLAEMTAIPTVNIIDNYL